MKIKVNWQFEIVRKDVESDDFYITVETALGRKTFTLEFLLAMFIKAIWKMAEKKLSREFDSAFFVVPSTFHQRQKDLITNACGIIGLSFVGSRQYEPH